MAQALSILTETRTLPLELPVLPRVDVPGLYVHIPFCFHKCHYCDFYSITRQSPERMKLFVDLVLEQADHWIDTGGPLVRPKTVFFGGGTPTLLPLDEMRRLLAGLQLRFDFSQCEEWTVEANPATVTDEYCRLLRDGGVNRLSFGAQSFDPADLAMLERHHHPDDVFKSVELARQAGFERLNLDLIYAICEQTLDSWSRSLETAISIGTEHLSCYGLTYEPNTPLAVLKRLGRLRGVEEEVELDMARLTQRRLTAAGLPPYEISNFSQPGAECRHNLLYWNGGDYLGLGPSAASHVQGWRWRNHPHLGEWERAIQSANSSAIEVEHLLVRRRAGELAMLCLRLSRGLVYQDIFDRFGLEAQSIFADPIERLSRLGLIETTGQIARLTESGWAVADSVAAEFLLEDQPEFQ